MKGWVSYVARDSQIIKEVDMKRVLRPLKSAFAFYEKHAIGF